MKTSTLVQIIFFSLMIFISIILVIVGLIVRFRTNKEDNNHVLRILRIRENLLLGSSILMIIAIPSLLNALNHSWTGMGNILNLDFYAMMLIAIWVVLLWGIIFMKLGYRKTTLKFKRHNDEQVELNPSLFGTIFIIIAITLAIVLVLIELISFLGFGRLRPGD